MEDRRPQSWSSSEHSTTFNSPLSPPSMADRSASNPLAPPQTVQYTLDMHRTPFEPYNVGEYSTTHAPSIAMNDGEDDVDSDEKSSVSKKDIHTINEQRRRDIIKQSYATLEKIVPTCKPNPGSTRLSRATVLLKTCDYMSHLEEQKRKQSVKLEALRKEVKALEIVKENYEQMVRAQSQQIPGQPSATSTSVISNDMKMKLFHNLMDCLFESFNSQVSVENFDCLSSCVISWLEGSCSPQNFQKLVSAQMKSIGLLATSLPRTASQRH